MSAETPQSLHRNPHEFGEPLEPSAPAELENLLPTQERTLKRPDELKSREAVLGRLAENASSAAVEPPPQEGVSRFTPEQVTRAVEAFKGIVPAWSVRDTFTLIGDEHPDLSYAQLISMIIADAAHDDDLEARDAVRWGVGGAAGLTAVGLAVGSWLTGGLGLAAGGAAAYYWIHKKRKKRRENRDVMEAARAALA